MPHKLIYQAILDIAQQHKRLDLVTLQDELSKRGHLEAIGGILFLVSLQEDIPAVGLIDQQCHNYGKKKAVLRQLINSASTIINNCYTQNDKGIDAVLDNAEKTIFQI